MVVVMVVVNFLVLQSLSSLHYPSSTTTTITISSSSSSSKTIVSLLACHHYHEKDHKDRFYTTTTTTLCNVTASPHTMKTVVSQSVRKEGSCSRWNVTRPTCLSLDTATVLILLSSVHLFSAASDYCRQR